jgi:hypothetical protein
MIDDAQWEAMEASLEKLGASAATACVLRCLHDVDTEVSSALALSGARLAALEEKASAESGYQGITARMHALEQARTFIAGLPTEQPSPRGYRDKAMSPAQRVEEEMRVARYLLEGS